MTEQTNIKLLYEALNAVIDKNDSVTASRRISKVIKNIMNEEFTKQETEEEFKVNDLGDEFSEEVVDDIEEDTDATFDQALIAVDELQDLFTGELSEEMVAKFDAVKDAIDELKVADEESEADATEELKVAVEDLRGDFQVTGDEDEAITEKFDEIMGLVDTEVPDEDEEEMKTEVETEEFDDIPDDVKLNEATEEFEDLKFEDKDGELDTQVEDVDVKEPGEEEELPELVDNAISANEELDKLLAMIDEKTSKEEVSEAWVKQRLPRNKLRAEEAGVKTNAGMKFPKPIFTNKAKLGINSNKTTGNAAKTKTKTMPIASTDAKKWEKVAKPVSK